jgi:putative acetyltransferase
MANFGLTIRPEESDDYAAIRHVNILAFGQPNEADLVDALRCVGGLTISHIAIQDRDIVGHIAFSPVTISSDTTTIEAIGLGPMAVLPEFQRQGIGSQLVKAGLDTCRQTDYGVVVVLGHPEYYPRFGFTPSKPHGIVWEHDVPEEVFMIKELQQGALTHTQGVVKYRAEFDHV